jgi:hypothetical protein
MAGRIESEHAGVKLTKKGDAKRRHPVISAVSLAARGGALACVFRRDRGRE